MGSKATRTYHTRRDRRKAKATEWARVPNPGSKRGHHMYRNQHSDSEALAGLSRVAAQGGPDLPSRGQGAPRAAALASLAAFWPDQGSD